MALDDSGLISYTELELAFRNHGMPLEALEYPLTPVGLHYLLTHYDIPRVDAAAWRLEVGGLVERPLELTLDELRRRPAVELAVTMECAGNGRALLSPRPVSQPWLHGAVGTAAWRGVPLAALLEEAGVRGAGKEVVFTGLDHGLEGDVAQAFERSLPLGELPPDVILAYEMNGQPLLPQHGFPLRLVVPGWYGMTNVKWLTRITVQSEPFTGYQQVHSYRLRQAEDEEGTPLTRIQPRALMVPPGRPQFPSRRRELAPGHHELRGRAWSGWAPVTAVDVSTDGGATWNDGELERDVDSRFAWCGWSYDWNAAPGGEHVLVCRARDGAGNVQPLEPEWNLGGYGNNAVQRVAVTVVR